MFTLNKKAKRSIEKSIGLAVDKIGDMSAEKVDKHIEKRVGKKLRLRILRDSRLTARGSVYLLMGRLLSPKKTNKQGCQI